MTDRISHPGDVPDAPPDYVTRRSTIARIWRAIEHVQGDGATECRRIVAEIGTRPEQGDQV